METIDFSKSFITWRVDCSKQSPKTLTQKAPYDLNNARVQADCYCELRDTQTGVVHEFVLGASCKSELVGVERDIWMDPNADFVPVMGRDSFMGLKAYDRADKGVMLAPPSLGPQPERQVVNTSEAFDKTRIDIVRCNGQVLETAQEIIESTLANYPLVARTQLDTERYLAILTYPVKTMNANERDRIYQTDTGPVLFPDLSRNPEDLMGGMELAFAAFNSKRWTEFILRAKVSIAEGISVYHYSKPVRIDCKNEVIRLEP